MNKWLHGLPRQLAVEMIERKLGEQKIKLSKRRLNELVDRLLKGEDDIQLDTGHEDASIEITDEDLAWLNERAHELISKLPAIIDDASEGVSQTILASLKKKWGAERRQQQRDMNGFRKRLEERWGAGFERLRMLVTIAREFGDNFNKDGHAAGGGSNPQAVDVLRRLHARSCQVTEEVICLMSSGFADGAMARWRTLQETAAVACLIGQHGDALAERYIAHEIVEARGAAIQYRKYQKQLGQKPISDAKYDRIEKAYQAGLQTHGEAFGGQFGWAAGYAGKKNKPNAPKKKDRGPTMADIQEAAGIDHLSPYYKMASHNVHANPKGVFFKLGLIGESKTLLAGPSNAGLTDPGHATALSLNQISSVLMRQNPNVDSIVAVKIMQRLADEIGDALLAAQHKLAEDERLFSEKKAPAKGQG
ncbi:DUF5677 domain-containing protein [Mesorhizobium sp. BH1-1-4]|uniref:DUF5677 domain-containing protein n=1 Tax=Mesorhizobium sp. BH1-1-4 TaxID=2876662 RepID=UPI001CD0E65F|nr:DUF5677 domain-containing protein [Mesorhizobium sp. BH1-1-4]MBZ9998028.1 DUF5677 domain-containing protein [Mesorhizobium sp. BH1-1-4]